MKTLDEVIRAYELCLDKYIKCNECPYHERGCPDAKKVDALHYLKEFQGLSKMWNDHLDKEQANPALTWDELRTMEGKPVWVEALLYKQWAVIAYVGDDHIRFEGANLYAPECRIYMGKDNGWQAYRKERE
jgi:hypothetical protein